MSIKDVLVLLDANSQAAGRYALSLASTFDAHLTAAALVTAPTSSIGFTGAASAFLTAVLEEERSTARQILEAFALEARRSNRAIQTEIAEASAGTVQQTLGGLARSFDLTLIQQLNPDVPGETGVLIEAALFGSGRPIIVVPYIRTAPLQLGTVLVAWDGSATAARAVSASMPLLVRAKRVEVVMVADGIEDGQTLGLRIVHHLGRHEIHAEPQRLTGADDIAGTLLSYAFESGADLMVMGGYGHSRFREFVLGGATRGILQAMTLPVLMSH